MSGQHTPGPWRFNADFHEIQAESGTKTLAVVDVNKGEFIGDDELAANARLIAAAPELLDLVKRISQWDSLDGAADGPFWKRECQRAIAKATGREP